MSDDRNSTRPPPPNAERVDLAKIQVRRLRRETPHHSKPFDPDEEERFARFAAMVEGNVLARIEDLREELGRDERPSSVHVQVAPPPAEKKHWALSALTGLAAVLAGCGALTGAIAGLLGQLHHVDSNPDLNACQLGLVRTKQQFDQQSKYNHALAEELSKIFAAQGVKVIPEPGALAVQPAELLPVPATNPNKVSKTPALQIQDPLPQPPAEYSLPAGIPLPKP